MKYVKYVFYLGLVMINIHSTVDVRTNKNEMKNPNLTKEAIKNGLDQIIQYHIDKGELHERAAVDVRSFAKYLVDQTDYTKRRLGEVIKKINYETIKPDEEYKVYPDLEFWRGVDDFGSSVALNYDGGVDILNDHEAVVKGQYDVYESPSDSARHLSIKNKKAIKIDLEKYPISLLGFYENKFNTTALFYAWIGYIWQEVEGHKCGLKVKTIQNNSIATFSLNDFLDGDFSSFIESNDGKKPPKLDFFFPRNLSFIELYMRASQTGYPFNPYNSYWRYFEKGDQFTEVVTYEFSTGIRTGNLSERKTAKINELTKHKNSGSALKYITDFTNRMIFEGWEEKFRPIELPQKMHPEAYDFDIWTGVYWSDAQTSINSKESVTRFEEKFGVKIPKSFFHYIRLLNGRQSNEYNMYFPINDLFTVKVKKFHSLDELSKLAEATLGKDPNHLWIGELEDERMLGISIDEKSEWDGQIVIAANGKVEKCDYNFEKFAKFAQGSPVQPELFAAENNDAEFLRKRLNEGWDPKTSYRYQNAVTQAAEYNSYEALEVLLEAGARLRHNKHRDMPYLFDEKTMKVLDKYQKD